MEIHMNKLDYSIHSYSSYSGNFNPENIKVNRVCDKTSRWTSDSNNPPQYIALKLHRPAVVKTIVFGKYDQRHLCNMKKFQVYGGMTEASMMLLLESGLRNDSVAEAFALKHQVCDCDYPSRYIKIVPLLSWGASFNFTIWFVELQGTDDPVVVDAAYKLFLQAKEKALIRMCLKHFRDNNYLNSMQSLIDETGIHLEDAKYTELRRVLVDDGNYEQCEKLIEKFVDDGCFHSYVDRQDYNVKWTALYPPTVDPPTTDDAKFDGQYIRDKEPRPGKRGGHQMCIDSSRQTIYLFGGWNGSEDVSDFWSYHIPTDRWTLISDETEKDGGPTPRSCHRMCIDTKRKQLFVIGRYLDVQLRTPDTLNNDFHMYDVETRKWTEICGDTAKVGGPPLTYDHQICMDEERRVIYTFGGKHLDSYKLDDEEQPSPYCGLYSYDVATDTWTYLLKPLDTWHDHAGDPNTSNLHLSRSGHSMTFHARTRKLYIFGGHRRDDACTSFLILDVDNNRAYREGASPHALDSAPSPSQVIKYTQRTTIDCDKDEIYLFSGLSKDKEITSDQKQVQSSLWVYQIEQRTWRCVYRNDNASDTYWKSMKYTEPCPRYAHQVVYDHAHKHHYMFGGNPGRCITHADNLRLDDLWRLALAKPTARDLLRECQFMIRRYKYRELASRDAVAALAYLQTNVYEIINASDARKLREFQLLPSELFGVTRVTRKRRCDDDDDAMTRGARVELFDLLMVYCDENHRQPTGNLLDILQL